MNRTAPHCGQDQLQRPGIRLDSSDSSLRRTVVLGTTLSSKKWAVAWEASTHARITDSQLANGKPGRPHVALLLSSLDSEPL